MGKDAKLQNADAINHLLNIAELDVDITNSITNKDTIALDRQLNVCPDIYCMLFPAIPEDPLEQDNKEESEEENKEDKQAKLLING
jgi:hypothetical protein